MLCNFGPRRWPASAVAAARRCLSSLSTIASSAGQATHTPPVQVHSARLSTGRRGLTCRSTGAPTAGHQARSGGTRYIFASPGLASCRRRPLSSTLGIAISMVAAVSASRTAKTLASATFRPNPTGFCAARCTAASAQRPLCSASRAKRPNLAAEHQRSVGGAAATREALPLATSAGGGSEYWHRSLPHQVSAAAQAQPSAPSSHARRCLTYRSTGPATAWHPGRTAALVHHRPRGQGATPPRAG